MTPTELFFRLRATRYFRRLQDSELATFAGLVNVWKLENDEEKVLLRKGESAMAFWIVLRKEEVELVGWESLLLNKSSEQTVKAVTGETILMLPKPVFHRFVRECPDFLIGLLNQKMEGGE